VVLGLERLFLLGILEPVFAIGPAVGIAFERDGPVFFAAGWIFRVAGDGGRCHRLGDVVLGEEICEINVVAAGRSRAQPLRVTDHEIISIALGVEFCKRLV